MENAKKRQIVADSHVLWFFSLTPLVYVLLLLYFMPDRVPMHMDIRGNITRWWGKENMIIIGAVLSLLIAGIAWSYSRDNVMGKARPVISIAAIIFVYAHFLQLLLRMMYVTPNAMNARLVGLDASQYFVLFFIPLYILCGLFIHKLKPNWVVGIRSRWTLQSKEVWDYTHRKARLPFLIASGLNYLILAIPPLTADSRLIASGLVTVLLLLYLFYESYREHQRLSCR
ncbi:MAG: SdpI family protein [Firmicutes bacterium]|nr:SdpI family protein [Dethiobacter sp.]MBS3888225.1 SdpI family protein [Bacillota bacterium]MBS4054003.1 SdpI family protein [Thermaerobacter sp.]